MGDNITPPQQAFNWVADVYGSTEEIKARGQVIVGLLHEDIGHLGIFVSGKVAKKEHAQIVVGAGVDRGAAAGPVRHADHRARRAPTARSTYEVELRRAPARGDRRAPESLQARRREAVRGGRRGLRVQPARLRAVRAAAACRRCRTSTAPSCRAQFHPLRFQRWAALRSQSLAVRGSPPAARGGQGAAPAARRRRSARAGREAGVRADQRLARLLPGAARRDRARRRSSRSTATCSRSTSADKQPSEPTRRPLADARELPFVKEALASIAEGGYAEALARVAFLLARKGEPLPLSRLQLKAGTDRRVRASCCRTLPRDEARRIRGEQEIIVRYEPGAGDRDAAGAAAPSAPTASACSTLLDRCWPTSACSDVEPSTASSWRCWSAFARVAGESAGRAPPRRAAASARVAGTWRAARWNAKHEKYERLIDALQGAAAGAHRGGASVRRSSLDGRGGRGQDRPDRADPGRAARPHRGSRGQQCGLDISAVRDRRRAAQPGLRRRGGARWCARARPRR